MAIKFVSLALNQKLQTKRMTLKNCQARWQVVEKYICNLFQSSWSFLILSSFCICCVIHVLSRYFCFTQFDGDCHCWILIDSVAQLFYSCGLSNVAFEWTWGWGWPCFDINLFPFVMEIMLKKYQFLRARAIPRENVF